jgi:hypothetical protein
MSLNHIVSPIIKPYMNASFNTLALQAFEEQLSFQVDATGGVLTITAVVPAGGALLTIPDPGVDGADFQLSVNPVTVETKTRVLTSDDSGKVHTIASAAAASVYTLPAPTTSGLSFKFIVTGTIANAVTISSSGANIVGLITALDGTAFGTAGKVAASTSLVLVAAKTDPGNNLTFVSDGTKYWLQGQISQHDGITLS